MKKSIFVYKPAMPSPVTVVPNEGSEGSVIPLYEVEFFDFTDEAIAFPQKLIQGIAPWDAWLQRSQITRH